MPAELLQEDSDWFEAWRAAGIDEEVYVPYFKQTDNGPDGWRDCFASSAAMLAASAHLVSSDNEYIWHLSKYGDTTSVTAQLQTLRALGLDVEFTQEGNPEMIAEAISRGSAVLVGWHHEGDLTRGEPPNVLRHLLRPLVGHHRRARHGTAPSAISITSCTIRWVTRSCRRVAMTNQGLASRCGSASQSSTTGG